MVTFCLALAELEGLAPSSRHISEHKPDKTETDNPGKKIDQYAPGAYPGSGAGNIDSLFP